MSCLTTVTGHSPVSAEMIDLLDSMSKEQALAHVQSVIVSTVQARDRYQTSLLGSDSKSEQFKGFLHCYVIDCNNIVKLKRLYDQIAAED